MNETVATFLRTLWRGAASAYYWTTHGKRSQWTPTLPLSDCTLGNQDVYIGVHPTHSPRGEYERARIQDVAYINCLFTEFDAKEYGSLANIREHIKALKVQPQVIVSSGGGYHCYWFVRDPVLLNNDIEEYIARTQASWVRLTGGDTAAKDLARVLRVPGTLNTKYDPYRKVEFARMNLTPEGHELYEINVLCSIADDYREDPVKSQPVTTVTTEKTGVIPGIVNAFATAKEGERNKYLIWSACRLYDHGLSDGAVQAELLPIAMRLGLPERETLATIASAAKTKRQPVREASNHSFKGTDTLADRRRSISEALNG